MKDLEISISAIFATIGGFLGGLLGGIDGLIYALTVFVCIDYLTGIMVAVVERKLSSEIGFRGIFKKVVIFCLVGIGSIMDKELLKNGSVLRTAIIFFYIANEGISILENVGTIGLPIPKKIKKILEKFKEEDDE